MTDMQPLFSISLTAASALQESKRAIAGVAKKTCVGTNTGSTNTDRLDPHIKQLQSFAIFVQVPTTTLAARVVWYVRDISTRVGSRGARDQRVSMATPCGITNMLLDCCVNKNQQILLSHRRNKGTVLSTTELSFPCIVLRPVHQHNTHTQMTHNTRRLDHITLHDDR